MARAQVSFSIVPQGGKLLSSISTQPTQVTNNENVLNRQTYEGIPVWHPVYVRHPVYPHIEDMHATDFRLLALVTHSVRYHCLWYHK